MVVKTYTFRVEDEEHSFGYRFLLRSYVQVPSRYYRYTLRDMNHMVYSCTPEAPELSAARESETGTGLTL